MFVDGRKMLHGGPQAFVPQPVLQSVRVMVEETVSVLASSRHFANGVKFSLDVDPLVPATVVLDTCGRRMLMNLMSNSCTNTEAGQIHVDVRSELRQPELLRFTVTDTGCGIKDELKPQLFEPFISNGAGVGLGMYMMKEQSEALGGFCGYTDNPEGKGTVVFFSIPFTAIAEKSYVHLVDADKPDTAHESAQPIAVSEICDRNSETLLLVDDNIQLLRLSAMELKQHGREVTVAHGAQEALDLMKSNTYSMVLCDLSMPHKDGIELCTEFRKWENENTTRSCEAEIQAIFAVTGFSDKKTVERCMAAGMQGVLQKPLDINKLTECLAQRTCSLPSNNHVSSMQVVPLAKKEVTYQL